MKKMLIALLGLSVGATMYGQDKLYIHQKNQITLGALISQIDSIYFDAGGSGICFQVGGTLARYPVSEIDSLSFGEDSQVVSITWNADGVSIVNPLAFEGVTVEAVAGNATVSSTHYEDEFTCRLNGSSMDGSLKVYTVKKFNLEFNGLSLNNQDGPAINIQTKKKCTVLVNSGTVNSLSDGGTYATSVEDQKATFFSEGQLVFDGSGDLTVKSLVVHAICSDDYIEIRNGTVKVTGAVKDGIHCNDFFMVSGGIVMVTSTGDGIDCEGGQVLITGGSLTTVNASADVKGICSDSTMVISGGTVDVTINGAGSKGLCSAQQITLSGGSVRVRTTGGVILNASGSGFNPAYCTAIKSDSTITLDGANMVLTATGAGNKGISSGSGIIITAGSLNMTNSGSGTTYRNASGVTDSYNASCLTADGPIEILGGTVICSASGSGGKGITGDMSLAIGNTSGSPSLNITTTGTRFTVSGMGQNAVTNEPKAISLDGAITVNSGTVTVSSNDDGLKSKTSITVNNGDVKITKSVEGIESPAITVNNGTINLIASDDGFNATKGNGGEANDGSVLNITGGNVIVNSSVGDGLDSNGNISITGGTIIVHGPERDPEVGMDCNGTCNVSGGFLVISGTNSNMTEGPSASSGQYSILARTNTRLSAATLFHIQDAAGNNILTFQPVRNYYSVILSSQSLTAGTTYYIYTGGSSTGTISNGLYSGGTYSGGTQKKNFTLSGKLTTVTF
jgi:trimeric autotransporter adhesin